VTPRIELLAWDESGLALLQAMNIPAQKVYLGGPESDAKLLDRHTRYLTYHRPGEVEMLRISVAGAIAGSVGYWEREEAGQMIYEIGWEVLAAWHGRGVGTLAAAALLRRLKPVARHPAVFAYPTPENAGSNGVCRKLGFSHIGTGDFEYPQGVASPHNIWRLELANWPPQGV
jgi:RimJ/RimL family protein N-acetyltransferase